MFVQLTYSCENMLFKTVIFKAKIFTDIFIGQKTRWL